MENSVEAATRSLFGVDADLLIVGATLFGPMAAVALGLVVFRQQQESELANQRFFANGLQKLHDTLSVMLSTHLQNYQIGAFIIRALRTYPAGHPLAPKPEEIQEIIGARFDSLPIDSLLPVQELLGDRVVLDWVMLALSDVTLEAKELEFQIRQPTAAYYRGTVQLDNVEIVPPLTAVLEAWNTRCSAHFALLDRLNDLSRYLMTNRPWTMGAYYRLSKKREVAMIVKAMEEGYSAAKKAHEDTADVLKTGGGTA